jgi:hypothetical protein
MLTTFYDVSFDLLDVLAVHIRPMEDEGAYQLSVLLRPHPVWVPCGLWNDYVGSVAARDRLVEMVNAACAAFNPA